MAVHKGSLGASWDGEVAFAGHPKIVGRQA